MILKIEQLDDLTFVIYMGDDGDPEQPLPWRNFPHTLTGQWGLIASPFWLAEVEQNPELAARPVGSGPFVVDSYEPRGSLEVSRNPDYWMTDADGNQLPYLDSISFRVIEDSEIAIEALQAGDVDVVSTSNGRAISTIQGPRRRVRRHPPGRVHRDLLRAPRPRQVRAVAGPQGAVRDVDGDRPAGVRRRHQQRLQHGRQRVVLPGSAGLSRGQRAVRGTGSRRRRRR